MKVGDLVKVNNRDREYTGEIVTIRWIRTTSTSIYSWKKAEALIQCKNGRVRAHMKDLEKICK